MDARLDEAEARLLGCAFGFEADPFALGQAMDVQRDVGVDEAGVLVRADLAERTIEVGCRGEASERASVFSEDEGHRDADPCGGAALAANGAAAAPTRVPRLSAPEMSVRFQPSSWLIGWMKTENAVGPIMVPASIARAATMATYQP